jgi:hypothetical protein
VKGLFPVADYWQKVGVPTEPVVISAQQASDPQDQATFHSFQLVRQDYHLLRLLAFHSSEARTAERRYTGSNNGRYMNPDLDALINRFQQTIPFDERMVVGGQILHHITDEVAVMPLFYDLEVSLASRRLRNAETLLRLGGGAVWDVQTWDIAS